MTETRTEELLIANVILPSFKPPCVCPIYFQLVHNLSFYVHPQLFFQFCSVASPLRGYPKIHHHPIMQISSNCPPVLSRLLSMDSSSRNRMPAATNQQNPRQRAPNSNTTSTTSPIGEVNGRVDQLALVQHALQNGATPTMIAGLAIVIVQMQAQAAYPDVLLTITSRIGPLERSATFRDGTWHGYVLTHDLIDPRSHMIYGEHTRPPWTKNGRFEFLHRPCNHRSRYCRFCNHKLWLLLH